MGGSYDRIAQLCRDRGTNVTALCRKAGVSRAALSELKAGRTKTLTLETARRLADALEVPLAQLLGQEETDTEEAGREWCDEELKVAYFRGADPTLTQADMDAMWQDAKDFRDFIIANRKRRTGR